MQILEKMKEKKIVKRLNDNKICPIEEKNKCCKCKSEPKIKISLEKSINPKIKISHEKSINILTNPKITTEIGTGDDINHYINEQIEKNISITYKQKQKSKNRISLQNFFKINKAIKRTREQGTTMTHKYDVISGVQNIFIINENKNKSKNRDLILRLFLNKEIKEHCFIKEYFRKWKYIIQSPFKGNGDKLKIKRSEKLEILQQSKNRENKQKMKNKIARSSSLEFTSFNVKKRDREIMVDLPIKFRFEKLKSRMVNNDLYEGCKTDIILKNDDDIFKKKRIKDLLIKFINLKDSVDFILRNRLSIWSRNVKYLPFIENAKIISIYFRKKLDIFLIKRNWRKIYDKCYLVHEKSNILNIIKKLSSKRNKLYKLLERTDIILKNNDRKYVNYIIIYWLLYVKDLSNEESKIKDLYTNILDSYIDLKTKNIYFNNNNKDSTQTTKVYIEGNHNSKRKNSYAKVENKNIRNFYKENILFKDSKLNEEDSGKKSNNSKYNISRKTSFKEIMRIKKENLIDEKPKVDKKNSTEKKKLNIITQNIYENKKEEDKPKKNYKILYNDLFNDEGKENINPNMNTQNYEKTNEERAKRYTKHFFNISKTQEK